MKILFTAIAIGVGLVVLAGYFIQIDVLSNLRVVLLEWAAILAGVALLVGIANLFYVHWVKMIAGQPNSVYSAVLIVSLVTTLGLIGWFGPIHPYSLWIFNYIQVPIESSLMAILAVILAYASARLLRRRMNLLSIIFLVTAVISLIATVPLFGFEIPGLPELRAWITQVPVTAGARGILLGVALGIIATGLRILMGSDRPYLG